MYKNVRVEVNILEGGGFLIFGLEYLKISTRMSRRVNYTVYNHGMAGMPRLNHDLYKMHLYFAKVSVSTCMKFTGNFCIVSFSVRCIPHFVPVLGKGGCLINFWS